MLKKGVMSDTNDIPLDHRPLMLWRSWFYPKQKEYIEAQKDYWEVVFRAGNGTGKTTMLYWSLISYALGVHPFKFSEPPLAIKVMIIDFEHGYGKIFVETCMRKIFMPARYEIHRKGNPKPLFLKGCPLFFCELHKAEEWISDKKTPLEIVEYPPFNMDPLLPLSMIVREPSDKDRTLMLKNGSFLFFQTSEQKKRLHSGTNFDVLGCDEVPSYQAYDESKRGLRTAKGGGKILHAFTPPFDEEDKLKGPDWTKFKLIDPFMKNEDKDVYVVNAAMADNPAITDDYIRKFTKGKTEQQVRIQLYGDYPQWGKLIFPELQDFKWEPKTKVGHIIDEFEFDWRDPDFFIENSIDWHGSKPAAILWTCELLRGVYQFMEKGDIVVFMEMGPKETEGMTISELKIAIREKEGWRQSRIRRYGDPKMKDRYNAMISGFSAWKEFHQGEVRLRLIEGWNRDPYVGYSIIKDFLRGRGQQNIDHPRLFIVKDCKTLLYNMKNHYNIPLKDGTAIPDPKFSDYCVSLRYIMQTKSRKIKKKMESKNRKWPIQSFGGDPAFGPYMGHYIRDHERARKFIEHTGKT